MERTQTQRLSPTATTHHRHRGCLQSYFGDALRTKFPVCVASVYTQVGVVPGVIFYFPDSTGIDPDRPLLRFAICKRRDTIEEAVLRIREMDLPAPK